MTDINQLLTIKVLYEHSVVNDFPRVNDTCKIICLFQGKFIATKERTFEVSLHSTSKVLTLVAPITDDYS